MTSLVFPNPPDMDRHAPLLLNLPCPPPLNLAYRVWRNHMVLTRESKAWKRLVWDKCRDYIYQGLWGGRMDSKDRFFPLYKKGTPVQVHVAWYRIPKQRSDIDAPLKLLLDAMQGTVYHNDRQVKGLSVWEDSAFPTDQDGKPVSMLVVRVAPYGGPGLMLP